MDGDEGVSASSMPNAMQELGMDPEDITQESDELNEVESEVDSLVDGPLQMYV